MLPIDRRTALGHTAALAIAPFLPVVVQTSKADPYADGKLIDGKAPMPEKGSFTVAVLPDT